MQVAGSGGSAEEVPGLSADDLFADGLFADVVGDPSDDSQPAAELVSAGGPTSRDGMGCRSIFRLLHLLHSL